MESVKVSKNNYKNIMEEIKVGQKTVTNRPYKLIWESRKFTSVLQIANDDDNKK